MPKEELEPADAEMPVPETDEETDTESLQAYVDSLSDIECRQLQTILADRLSNKKFTLSDLESEQ